MKKFVVKYPTAICFIVLLIAGIGISVTINYYANKSNTLLGILNPLPCTHHKLPHRIISLTPLGTETIFALGCGDKVVGVSDFCTYPPAARQKTRLGGIINPNLERLIALKPDLVVVLGKSAKIESICQQYNIPGMHITMANIQGVFLDMKRLGKRLGCSERANQLCVRLNNKLGQLRKKTSSVVPVRVFLTLSHIPGSLRGLSSMGSGTSLNDLIEIAGGINIFNDLPRPYAEVSMETLVKRQPQVIIETCAETQNNPTYKQLILGDWARLKQLPAVINKRIYFVDANLIMKPGPRMYEIAEKLARIIHPELFGG